jgi:aldehyde:ferredoxin oxidoreductase
MDTISTGNTIAFLFDCYEKGLIGNDFAQGLDLSWGNSETIIKLIEMIAKRDGCGDVLAEGSLRTAQHIGKECEKIVIHAKGQEFPGFEVRRANGTGLSFATSNRGACHLRSCFYIDELLGGLNPEGLGVEKVHLLIEKENLMALVDSFVMCKFGQRNGEFTIDVISEMLGHLTGMIFSSQDLKQIGERIYNLERHYNLSMNPGMVDVIPDRFFDEDLQDGMKGGSRISREKFAEAVSLYYGARGWNSDGVPKYVKTHFIPG